MLLLCWIAPVAALALFLYMGFLGTEGTYTTYIALPYISILMPIALLLSDAYKLTIAKESMKRAEFERSVAQMRRCTIAGIALAGITLAGQTALIFFAGVADPPREWLFWFLCLALFSVFLWFFYAQKRVRVTIHR